LFIQLFYSGISHGNILNATLIAQRKKKLIKASISN
jgi:hypothetical protein